MSAVLVTGARAADLGTGHAPLFVTAKPAKQSWSGPYLGLEGGVSNTLTEVKANGRTKELSRVDAAFGLFAGHNWQVSRFVLGVEGSASYIGGTEKGRHPTLGAVSADANWTVAAKARAGVPIGNFLPYLSAGIAVSEHGLEVGGDKQTSIQVGPVLGAGVEVALKDKWRIRADYSLTGIVNDTSRFNGTSVRRQSGNQRLMLGLSRSF
ncbi:MAG: porin family protein [Pseudomonadota bacterium]